jgi:hypothetical protein
LTVASSTSESHPHHSHTHTSSSTGHKKTHSPRSLDERADKSGSKNIGKSGNPNSEDSESEKTTIQTGDTIILTFEPKVEKRSPYWPTATTSARGTTHTGHPTQPSGETLFAAWAAVTGPIFTPATPTGEENTYEVVVPVGVHGQSYVVLTSSGTDATDGEIVAGPALVEISGTTGSPFLE